MGGSAAVITGSCLVGLVLYISDHFGGWLAVRKARNQFKVPTMAGKVVLITGGNAGIGWQAVKLLASAGATVVLACRSVEKGRACLETIPPDVAKNVTVMYLDLGNFESIVKFAKDFRAKFERLHVLILNAGLAKSFLGSGGWSVTSNGLEEMVGVSFLGHFLLTMLLMPLLRNTPGSRVIGQGSVAMANTYVRGVDPSTWTSKPRDYQDWTQYGQAKLAMRLFMPALQKREPKVLCLANHPGVVAGTTLMHQDNKAGIIERLYEWFLFTTIAMRPEDGGMQTAWLASAPADRLEGGECYGPIGRKLHFISHPLMRLSLLQVPVPVKDDYPGLWDDAERIINEKAGKKLLPIAADS